MFTLSDGELREPRLAEFEDFLLTLTVGEERGVSKATGTSLQFPSVHYFALFNAKCLTAREKGGILSAPDLAILHRALHNDHTFSLGAIVACRVHLNRTKGKIHGGIYATRLASHCYLLSMHWFSLEEERVMQQSSVSISLSFLEQRYQSCRRQRTSHLVTAQTIKNLATNAIKGLSIPSRSLAKVRSNRDNKVNIYGIFVV